MERAALGGNGCRAPLIAALLVSAVLAVSCGGKDAYAAPPSVVTTILPIHGIASAVMEGVGSPKLLLPAGASPHTYALKPSDAKALNGAAVIVWVGPQLETFMEKPLMALGGRARILELSEVPGTTILKSRSGGAWDAHGHEEHHGKAGDHDPKAGDHDHEDVDGHMWLDPRNVRTWAEALAVLLTEIDPANAAAYKANGARFAAEVTALEGELAASLAPVRGTPFIVFHDAYQYFENRFGLQAAGAITVSPERAPGARRLSELRERIRALGARCVFTEPQFPPRIARTVVEGTPARLGTLDPVGTAVAGGDAYYRGLLTGLARGLKDCLAE